MAPPRTVQYGLDCPEWVVYSFVDCVQLVEEEGSDIKFRWHIEIHLNENLISHYMCLNMLPFLLDLGGSIISLYFNSATSITTEL